jgi:hypothetical protein
VLILPILGGLHHDYVRAKDKGRQAVCSPFEWPSWPTSMQVRFLVPVQDLARGQELALGSVDALDGDDCISAINEPNESAFFGERIFPSIGLPTADGTRVLKII